MLLLWEWRFGYRNDQSRQPLLRCVLASGVCETGLFEREVRSDDGGGTMQALSASASGQPVLCARMSSEE